MKRSSLFMAVIISMLMSCTEQPSPVPMSYGHANISDYSTETGFKIARRLSMIIQDSHTREAIKDELLRKFDGDYNFLLAKNNTLLASQSIKMKNTLAKKDWTSIYKEDPLLQIAMPDLPGRSIDEWDTENYTPIVVYRPPGQDLNVIQHVPAFENGVEFSFDLTQEPDAPILVVSHNERVTVLPKTRKSLLFEKTLCKVPVFSDQNFDYYLKTTLENCSVTVAPPSTTPGGSSCDRSKYDRKDYVTRAKFTSINIFRQAESYLDGNPEVYFIITLASKNPSGFSSLRKSFPSSDRSEWKNCGIFSCTPEWHEHNLPVFYWDEKVFGDLVRYDWFEEDYSKSKTDLSLGLSTKIEQVAVSGSVKVTISAKDYFLDQDFVSFCDKANGSGSEYNTGKLLFTINQQ